MNLHIDKEESKHVLKEISHELIIIIVVSIIHAGVGIYIAHKAYEAFGVRAKYELEKEGEGDHE